MFMRAVTAIFAATLISGSAAQAQETVLASFIVNGNARTFTQTAPDASVSAGFAIPAANCDDICVAPIRYSPWIETVGERDVIDFVVDVVAPGEGLLIDARQPGRRSAGFIAGSVNVPSALLAADNPYLPEILLVLGASSSVTGMGFDNVLPVMVFDDGPLSDDAHMFIESLLAAGYPADKVTYYRGGMQIWTALGLSFDAS